MDGVPQIILVLALIVIPFSFFVNGAPLLQSLRHGEQPLRYRGRDTVGWGLLDMAWYLIVFSVIVGLGTKWGYDHAGITQTTALHELSADDQAVVMLAYGVSSLIATLLCLAWNGLRFQSLDGFDPSTVATDIVLGCRWFTVLIVPVLVLQFLLTLLFPTHHPLVDMLQEGDSSLLPVAAFVAVVSAPIFEEIFFRLFLQGWLEKLQITWIRTRRGLTSKADRDAVLLGGRTSGTVPSFQQPTELRQDESDEPFGHSPFDDNPPVNPWAATSHDEGESKPVRQSSSRDQQTLWKPILFSSGMFALAHWSHGPDWIPLFFLAIGLGYLYQRTGRILPSMIVHVLVNSLAIIQLWQSVSDG